MASRYDPLTRFLTAGRNITITLSFEQIELILGCKLPPSAHIYTLWWRNNDSSHQHCWSWNGVGYDAEPDLVNKLVAFHPVAVPATV